MIKKHNPNDEYYFEEGCHIIETSDSADNEDVSIAHARIEKGQRTKWHSLNNTTERYVILSGCGAVEAGTAKPCDITTGDVVIVPASTRQRIKNTGENDLLFLAICSPRFQKKTTARDQFEPRMGTIERPLQFSFIAEKSLTAKGWPVNCA